MPSLRLLPAPRRSARPSRFALVAAVPLLLLLAACTGDDTDDDAATADDAPDAEVAEADTEEGGSLRFAGPEDGELLNAEAVADLTFEVHADDPAVFDDLVLLLDGDDVTADAEVSDDTLTYAPTELEDGERVLAVAEGAGDTTDADDDASAAPVSTAGDDTADEDALHTWRFEVRTEPPPLELEPGAAPPGEPVALAGTTAPGATVTAADQETAADDDGAFTLELGEVDGAVTVVATDEAGNTTEVEHEIAAVASRVELDEFRAVHATFWAWGDPELREPIVQMLDDGRINAIQLDLKDEGGHVGYDSEVELADEMGAAIGPLDLEAAVAELHDRDVAVIGRIVAFADPVLAEWAWNNDRRDWVIQERDGSDLYRGSYAGFSNFTHEDVIEYNLAIAEEAAAAGVDHILWDYIRRPEGFDSYTVPGLEVTPEEAIVEFTAQADERLAPYGITHGASVYGIAADRPTQIGQDIPGMAEHLDYVAPMIYPSHWGPGEYGVEDPNRQPYDIIRATLEVWDEAVEGTDARVVPWLEDTPYRAWDRPFQIREQIRATQEHGIDSFLMWNAASRYTPDAYESRD